MKKLLLALLLILLGFYANCSAATTINHGLVDVRTRAPVTFQCPPRTIRVSFDSRFTQRERFLAEDALLNLKHLGVRVQVVGQNQQDVEVRRWRVHDCQDMILGMHITHAPFVLVDPTCMSSDQQYQAVVVHEVGHWLGMRHVCQEDRRTTDVCSPIGTGLAVLNPYLDWDHFALPSTLDIAEYNRVCWVRLGGLDTAPSRVTSGIPK